VVDVILASWKLIKARRRLAMLTALGLAMVLGNPLAGQSPFMQFPSTNNGRLGQNYPDSSAPLSQDPNSPDQKRIRMLNDQRQKSLISDTEKLLKLAKELNDQVAQNDSARMSDAELRKVAEIGKLARSVKDKMSFSMGAYPSVNVPLTIQPGIQ